FLRQSVKLSSREGKVCVTCLLLPIPIFAILGNLFIMVAVARFQSLQTATNAFVVSLAVADFLVAVLVMPFSLVRSVDSWHFGHCFCQVHFMLDITLCTSSIFNLSCVALDRYIAVCDPLHYLTRMPPRRVVLLLVLCWILPLILSCLCVFLGMYNQTPPAALKNNTKEDAQTCQALFYVPYAFVSSAVSFFIPMGFILFAYGKIFMAAQRQVKWILAIEHQTVQYQMNQMRSESSREVQTHIERHSLKKERKAARTLGLIVGVFLFCWLPFFCVNLIYPLCGYNANSLVLEAFIWLGYTNSSLNPFIYATFNRDYRRAFVLMLGCASLRTWLRPGFTNSHFQQTQHVANLETISR
uniref:5-hydroxytryptamine receptor 4-like n=1 Tax=Sphaeramia orbicularis TaxID=375764 RepID=A0A673BG72_9TELE